MKPYIKTILAAIFWLALATGASAQKDRYLVEGEAFQFKGKWSVENQSGCMGGKMLRLNGGGSLDPQYDALTAVEIWEAGEYTVWVRSADYAKLQGTRLFRLSVNGQEMQESGKHGKDGFWWENIGKVQLERGKALLRLHDTRKNFGRCDAILLIKDSSVDPNLTDRKEVGKWRKNPVKIETEKEKTANVSVPVDIPPGVPAVASAENGQLRISFVKAGGQTLACRTEMNVNGIWRRFMTNSDDHKVFLITAEDSPVDNDKFFPSWKNATAKSTFTLNGKTYSVSSDDDCMNPFVSGTMSEAIPVNAVAKGERCIEVEYVTRNGSVIKGLWTLPESGSHIEVELVCTPATSGMYSMGVAAFQPIPEASAGNILLPPMFQYRRYPEGPVMLLSSMMQQPLAIAESSTQQGGMMTSFVSGDGSIFNGEWGSVDWSPAGFSVRNWDNAIQPVAFSPVMGMEDSRVEAGKPFGRKFIVGVLPAGWTDALEYISDNVYEVNDYRKQTDVSLTDAMFNIIDLMKDKEHGGWDDSLKGFYDIEGDPETAPTVVHAAPLAIIAAAMFMDDEKFYTERALPTIEYLLSRSGYRWAKDIVPSGYNKTLESLDLNPFKSQFNTSCYEGLDRLTGGLNPWLSEIALPGGELRDTKGYSVKTLSWVQALSAYRMTGNPEWLRKATVTADRYIALNIYKNTTQPVGQMAFYNTNVYAAWWNLIDLYEATNDNKYLDAAMYGAASTIAGIRSYPAVKDEMQTIHPGGHYEGNTTMWWKGSEKFRLGYPRVEGDSPERQVPQWKVSPVGLGFEQAGTYFLRTKGKQVRPVFMSSWAPHLLRLHRYTGKEIYRTYARNAVIGRFANYPGYYATGYTDITMSADFPYRGPDVSSIYYHHIPPHLAFTWDFLVSEAISRSGGNADFPYSLQEGFVWFSNRIYGGGTGRIFKDTKARLWMKRGLVETDNPAVNYVTAISDRNFWVLLCNESGNEENVTIKVDREATGITGETAVQYTETGKTQKTAAEDGAVSVTLPAKGFRAVAIPAENTAREMKYAPLRDGMKVIDTGGPFGKVFLFRIRSPFGWDSVYGFAETHPQKDRQLSVEAECNGKKCEVTAYPFEWSFTGLGQDEKAAVRLILKADGQEDRIEEITL